MSVSTSTGESVIAQGIEGGCVNVPLHKVKLVSDLVTGSVVVGTRPTLPIKGVSLLLGNDLAGGKVVADPKVTSKPITLVSTEKLEEVIPGIFPSCAVTRAMAKKAQEEPKDCKQSTDILVDLSDTFLNNYDHDVQNSSDTNPKARVDSEKQDSIDCQDVSLSKSKLISEQENDPELAPLFKLVLPPVELDKVPVGYYVRNGVLMRKWRPPNVPASEEWSVVHQIVVPKVYQSEILKLAHESPMGGHLDQSSWASPCVLVPKPDGSIRYCTDYRKVNVLSKTDSFPIPRMEDCIDRIGNAKYITKCDLLKGYWCVPLTERAKEISAFVTPDGLYQYKVMPFGMKNSQATFQRLMNICLKDLEGVEVYVDDIVIFSDTWEEHLKRLEQVLFRLKEANLTVNLSKSDFVKAKVIYLGHVVGHGVVTPIKAKVKSIIDYPVPENKKSLMRFLGMAGYYRKFCKNFSEVTAPLTELLKKNVKYHWSETCQKSFDKVKNLLCLEPVLTAPDFSKPFRLAVDASDVGAGAVLLQCDNEDIEHPICYFFKKI